MMLKLSLECDALGTHWWIELPEGSSETAIKKRMLARITSFESDYSRFLPTSYVGRHNANKSIEHPPQELLAMLAFARDIYMVSGRIFNISVGGTLTQLGYGKGQPESRLGQTFWEQVLVSERMITIPRNVEIDLGGFGKGWLIDALGELLRSQGYSEFMINGGGDILVSSDEPIEFALEHPLKNATKVGTTRISHGALAVSSTTKRVWKQGTKSYHHIIDPRQETSSTSDIVATYIRAETALIADTMATILLIAPELRGALTERYDLQSILLDKTALSKS